ncbi:hypothetical protein ACBI99_44595 [Nonomuraea sp. ATR24]|uniref:hypothetical protein n=1 Tax=Nonomuraea sp. ATR24 TaxID=1676744 RepID=UPI0035BEEB62
MYDDALPFTGAGLTIAGVSLGLPTVLAVAAGLVLTAIWVYRLATRSRRRARQ